VDDVVTRQSYPWTGRCLDEALGPAIEAALWDRIYQALGIA